MFGKRPPRSSGSGSSSRGRGTPARPARRTPVSTMETVVFEAGAPGAASPSSRTGQGGGRLVDIATDWLLGIVALRGAAELGDPAGLRARVLELKSQLEQRARALGINAADVDSAVFSLVALTDESVLRSRGATRDAWASRSLQLELYGQHVAGEEFFTRLDQLRRQREARIEALEVAYACLSFGFLGRYGLSGPEKVQALIAEVQGDIAAVRGSAADRLAPHAQRRDERLERVGEQVPIWLSLAVFLPAMLLVWLVIFLVANGSAASAARTIGQLIAR
jgi:type VI secretion system protein ImpK